MQCFQNFVLFGGRDARPRVRVHRDEYERNDGVPRVPLPEEKDGANGDADGGSDPNGSVTLEREIPPNTVIPYCSGNELCSVIIHPKSVLRFVEKKEGKW